MLLYKLNSTSLWGWIFLYLILRRRIDLGSSDEFVVVELVGDIFGEEEEGEARGTPHKKEENYGQFIHAEW